MSPTRTADVHTVPITGVFGSRRASADAATTGQSQKSRDKYPMNVNVRREERKRSNKTYSISWVDESGLTRSVDVPGVDFSPSAVGILSAVEVRPGTSVYIQAQDGHPTGYSTVRHCTRRDDTYVIGLELDEPTKKTSGAFPNHDHLDHYEFLQISPNAQAETIHRVYRFLAARFHPDNPETGDPEKFVLLNQAFEVLSDPERRAEYDAKLRSKQGRPNPAFESVDFLDGVEGEVNRRLAVLSLLYRKCRANVHDPKVSLRDLETAMGFPREYLDFTTWYLRTKKYITREDNSDFALTALGVDYVEANCSKIPILAKLLTAGTGSVNGFASETGREVRDDAGEMLIPGPGDVASDELVDSE
jgi:curved DNA-binding protein